MHSTLCELEIFDVDFRNQSFGKYAPSLGRAAKSAKNRLVVVLSNEIFSISPSSRAPHFDGVQALLTFTYTCCITSAESAALDIIVLLKGWSQDPNILGIRWDCIFDNESAGVQAVSTEAANRQAEPGDPEDRFGSQLDQSCKVVSVNGTFDHLHVGHKTLVTASAWLACDKFICAVSHDQTALVARKSLALGLQDYATRLEAIQAFLQFVVPGHLETVVVPVTAPYGESTVDGSVSAVVLSAESFHHRERIQEIRTAAHLAPVQFFCVDLVTGNVPASRIHDDTWVNKISSSYIRRTQLPDKIFILINGFVGVGKFTVARHLASFLPSARVIDNHLLLDPADALCPRTFPGYQDLRQQFRDVAFKFLLESDSSSFIFTANCSVSELGTRTAHQYERAAEECGATFFPIILECGMDQVRERVTDPKRAAQSRFKLRDPDAASKIWGRKEIFKFNC